MKYTLFFFILFILSCESKGQTKNGFDISNSSIPNNEILGGGPAKDGIPSIDNPVFISAEEVSLNSDARILGVYHNGIAKAYPINILNFHEIVNDKFQDKPVVLTYCPLCGSGIAFDVMINGQRKTFGVSGLLYNSDVLLYDRQTESLWSQLKYQAVSGPMLGTELDVIPTDNTTWANWKSKYPETFVLSENTGFNRDYALNPYPNYDQSTQLYFPVSDTDDRYHPKEMVIGIEFDGKYKAYPFSELAKSSSEITIDTFQGKTLKIKYDHKSKSAEILDHDGNKHPAITNFWFAWYAFHPETEVFTSKQK